MSRFKHLSIAIASFGILFHLNNWTGGDFMVACSCVMVGIYCLIRVFRPEK